MRNTLSYNNYVALILSVIFIFVGLSGCGGSSQLTMTANSYTQEFEVENTENFRKALSYTYSVAAFRVFETDSTYDAEFRDSPSESYGSLGHKSQIAVIWSPEPGVIRVHGWTRVSNHDSGNRTAVATSESTIKSYIRLEDVAFETYEDLQTYGEIKINR